MGDQQVEEAVVEDVDLDQDEDFEPPLNPVLMTLSTIGLFIAFVAFVAVCIPLWLTGSGH